jgi:hypothetical protein
MMAFVAGIAIVAMSLGSQVELAVADSPPKLKVGPSCNAAARAAITLGRTTEMCMGDERAAQDQLTNNWSQYSRAHKTWCVGMTTTPLFGDFGKNPKGYPSNQPATRNPK